MSNPTPEQKLAALGLTLPAVPAPLANYVPYRWEGNLLFLSGQGPKKPDGTLEIGRLGKNATVDDGYRAARLAGLQLFAVAKSARDAALAGLKEPPSPTSAITPKSSMAAPISSSKRLAMRAATPARPSGWARYPTASWSRSKPFF